MVIFSIDEKNLERSSFTKDGVVYRPKSNRTSVKARPEGLDNRISTFFDFFNFLNLTKNAFIEGHHEELDNLPCGILSDNEKAGPGGGFAWDSVLLRQGNGDFSWFPETVVAGNA